MRLRLSLVVATATFLSVGYAKADSITVLNPSFETLPSSGLPNGCGAGCSYSVDQIPGWSEDGGNSGQFQPGSSSGNFSYFNYIPDGVTVAYTNGGNIYQTVGATTVAGTTYTLTVDIGQRNDGYCCTAYAALYDDGTGYTATGAIPPVGGWSVYTASFTALTSGDAITINLGDAGPQGDFDNVTLTATSATPEPGNIVLLGTGLLGVAGALRRRISR